MPWDEGLVNSLVYDSPSPTEGRVIAYPKAVNEALDLALGRDARVFVLGQGVDDPSAMFGTTRGLKEKYGGDRGLDRPGGEGNRGGGGAGVGMEGVRPGVMR